LAAFEGKQFIGEEREGPFWVHRSHVPHRREDVDQLSDWLDVGSVVQLDVEFEAFVLVFARFGVSVDDLCIFERELQNWCELFAECWI
jgi:hypothetical protein